MMCLAIPGRILEIYQENGLNMGKIDFSGVINRICLAYVPEASEGDYVVVHAGFAISVLDEDEAQKTLESFAELARYGNDPPTGSRADPSKSQPPEEGDEAPE